MPPHLVRVRVRVSGQGQGQWSEGRVRVRAPGDAVVSDVEYADVDTLAR